MGKLKAAKAAVKVAASKEKKLGFRGKRSKSVAAAPPAAKKRVTKTNRKGNVTKTKYTGIAGAGKVTGTRKIASKTVVNKKKSAFKSTTKVHTTSRSLRPAIGSSTRGTPKVSFTKDNLHMATSRQKNPISAENAIYTAIALTPAEKAEAKKVKGKRGGSTTYKRRLASGKTITVTRKNK